MACAIVHDVEGNKVVYRTMAARDYYGRHATGSVLMRNGSVEYHGQPAAARRLLKNAIARDEERKRG